MTNETEDNTYDNMEKFVENQISKNRKVLKTIKAVVRIIVRKGIKRLPSGQGKRLWVRCKSIDQSITDANVRQIVARLKRKILKDEKN